METMSVLALTLLSLVLGQYPIHFLQCPHASTANCSSLTTQVKCVNSYYSADTTSGHTQQSCYWTGSACTTNTSANCVNTCPYAGTTDCTTLGSTTCEDYYMTNGYTTWFCYWSPTSSSCAYYPYRYCNQNSVSGCSGTLYSGGCSAIASQTTCLASYQTGAHGGPQQCGYTTGVGCYANAPCH